MSDFYDYFDIGEGIEDIQWKWFEKECINTITELSRQLRTFFKFKEQLIICRFRSSFIPAVNRDLSKFRKKKKELQDKAPENIQILKHIKKQAQSVEQGIRQYSMRTESTLLHQLIEITRKLFVLIHYFSEQELHDHARLLKLVVKLVREACLVKKSLDFDLGEFYAELELNYEMLEEELEEMLFEKVSQDRIRKEKTLEERV
jgi:hypothetical protein